MDYIIFLLSFALLTISRGSSERTLSSPHITTWGQWGLWTYCPSGHFVTGMQLYTHPPQGIFKDDRGLTGIRLFCNAYGEKKEDTGITSSTDSVGNWGKKYFCPGAMTGFQLQSEHYRTFFIDDTAANNLRMFCDENPTKYQEGDGNNVGKWTDKKLCEKNEMICGINTQVDKTYSWDQTGLNNVEMKCCDIPNPLEDCVPQTNWVLVASCQSNLEDVKLCKYLRKAGVSYIDNKLPMIPLYEKAGFGLKKLGSDLHEKFQKASHSNAVLEELKEYYWSFAPNYVWAREYSVPANLTAKRGHKVQMYQLRGSCGKLQVWGTKLKKVALARMGDHETRSTMYLDFNDDQNEI